MMVELRALSTEMIPAVLALEPVWDQRYYVKPAAYTVAMAYVSLQAGTPGFLSVICQDGQPVGILRMSRVETDGYASRDLRRYPYTYRLTGFFVDRQFQHRGVGRAALSLALEKLRGYPDAAALPVTLEVHWENTPARRLYRQLGFADTGTAVGSDDVFVRPPEMEAHI